MIRNPAEILRRALYIDQEIRELVAERNPLEDRLGCLQGFDFGKPVVKSSGGRGSVEKLAIAVADDKEKIAGKIRELIAEKQRARTLIETRPEGKDRNVLVRRYILLEDWEKIAAEMGYSYRHVIRLHGEALRRLKERCP